MMVDRRKLAFGAVAVVVLALGGGVAIAAQQQEEPKIDRAAEKAALNAVPGEVKETELEREGGSAVYEVEVASEDGKLHEVTVDASNGRILGQEMEGEKFFEEDNGSNDHGPEDAE